MSTDFSTTENQLKKRHAATMWTSLTEGHEDRLESEMGDQKLQRVDVLVYTDDLESSPERHYRLNDEDNLRLGSCKKWKPIELFCNECRNMRDERKAGNPTSSRII